MAKLSHDLDVFLFSRVLSSKDLFHENLPILNCLESELSEQGKKVATHKISLAMLPRKLD